MGTTIRTRLVKIGNSQGIRIPKPLIEQSGLAGEVEARAGQLIIRPALPAREGWEEQFRAMAEAGDDRLLDSEATSLSSRDDEWHW